MVCQWPILHFHGKLADHQNDPFRVLLGAQMTISSSIWAWVFLFCLQFIYAHGFELCNTLIQIKRRLLWLISFTLGRYYCLQLRVMGSARIDGDRTSCYIVTNTFQLVQPEDISKVLENLSIIRLSGWVPIPGFWRILKDPMERSLLNKLSMDLFISSNYPQIFSLC